MDDTRTMRQMTADHARLAECYAVVSFNVRQWLRLYAADHARILTKMEQSAMLAYSHQLAARYWRMYGGCK